MEIVVIGLGGIGTILVERLARYVNFNHDIEQARFIFVDGDSYEAKNFERQDFFDLGKKATIKARELSAIFDNIEFDTVTEYITEENVEDIIKEDCMIFMCVDNHKTRKLVSDYCSTLNNISLISGGNDYIDGNVQIYLRKGGRDLTPNLCAYHPEIDEPDDKSPHEMSCEELSVSEPQLYFTNLGVATLMCWAFYNVVIRAETNVSEIYFDIEKMACHAKVREVPKTTTTTQVSEGENVCVTQEHN
jgi:molybdopterin/thiamine biosynthesis adenylyltransferase